MIFFLAIIIFALYFFIITRMLDFLSKNKPKIEFIKNSYSLKINNKTYKYSDIKNITIEEDIGDFTYSEKFIMGDIDHGRLINDRINFVLTEEKIVQTVETTRRSELYYILKTISKFKKLDFDINLYKPPIITSKELMCLILALILISFIL